MYTLEANEPVQRQRPRTRTLAALAAWAVALTPATSLASGILVSSDEKATQRSFKVYVGFDGKKAVLIEEVLITAEARRIGWIRAFPKVPDLIDDLDAPFDILEERTAVRKPYRVDMQDRLFGPSLVTLLLERLKRGERVEEADPDADIVPRRLKISEGSSQVFVGKTYTSTLTRKRHFPRDLEGWLATNQLALSQSQELVLYRYLDSGWVVIGTLLDTRSKRGGVRAQVGPTRYVFETDAPVHPVLMSVAEPDPSVDFRYWLAAPNALVPAEFDTIWDDTPWEEKLRQPNEFVIRYNQAIGDAVETDLVDVAGVAAPSGGRLVHGAFNFRTRPHTDMQFAPAKKPTELPAPDGQGSPWDIFICMVLGLAPLLFTPEAWFFIYLGARSRAKSEVTGEAPLGMAWWPLYAIAVAAYWAATLTGPARLAALLPTLVGIARLITTSPQTAPKPIRVKFQKKKDG